MTFLFTSALLIPLAWAVLNGPHLALCEIAGGLAALAWLAARGQLLALVRLGPFLAAGLAYAAIGYFASQRNEAVMFPYQMEILLLFYGLPAGLCLRRLAQKGGANAVAFALVAFTLAMTVISLVILRMPEVQRITGEMSGTFQRTNGEYEEVIVYLRFFKISNIIIGVIPFTLFALATLPAAVTARNFALRLFIWCSVALATFANVLIATRTALLAAAASSALVLAFAVPRLPVRRWFSFAVTAAVAVAALGLYFARSPGRFEYLLDRFAEAGSDGRLVIWREAWELLQRFPNGQVLGRLQTHSWAHNLFLDVGLTYGWTAIVAVLAMFGCAFYFAAKAVWTEKFFHSAPNVLLLGWLLATCLAGMIQPPQPVFLSLLHVAVGFFAPLRSARQPAPRAPQKSRRLRPAAAWRPAEAFSS